MKKPAFFQRATFALTLLISLHVSSSAQQTLTQVNGWNCYVHLPWDYNSNNNTYPTILFFPGIGEVGTNAAALIRNGPGAYITQGWNGNVKVGNDSVKFIVISLQPPTGYPTEFYINQNIQTLKSLYRINNQRLYLTGLSMGGWCCTTFVTGDAATGPYTYASQVAAIVDVQGVKPDDNLPYPNLFDNFAAVGGRYVGFEQSQDFRDKQTVVNRMNTTKPNSAIYVQTTFGGGGHCCWSQFYGGGGTQPSLFTLDGISQNIYQWFARQNTTTVNNQAPVANAGADVIVQMPNSSTSLSGTGTDQDGTIASYNWSQVSGPNTAAWTNANASVATVSGLINGTYQFRLTVKDNAGATATDNITVIVNKPPTVNAGNDQTITLPTVLITLSGLATDADGTIASYGWTKISGPTTGLITSVTSAITTVTALVQGTYTFVLTAKDNYGGSATDTIKVTVNPGNQIPTVNAGVDKTITLPTSTVTLTGTAADADGTISSYGWTKFSGPTSGTIASPSVASTSVIGLTAGTYVFVLQVKDNAGATATDTIKVTVNPANLIPTVNAGVDKAITLPTSTVTLTGTAADVDGTISSYGWTKFSGPTSGTIASPSATSTSVTGLTAGSYVFVLQVKDNAGATATDTVKVLVNPAVVVNIPPVANAGADKLTNLPTNSVSLVGSGTDANGTISTYAWSLASGPTGATIGAPNAASTTASALSMGTYYFVLTVTDNAGATGKDTVKVVVNSLPEPNAGLDQTITLPVSSYVLQGSSYDLDGTVASVQWLQMWGPNTAVFSNVATFNNTASGLIQGIYVFRLKVTDNQGAIAMDDVIITVNPAPVPVNKFVNVNIASSSVTCSNSQWNNWNTGSSLTSSAFLYSDQSASTITATLSQQAKLADNGVGYAPNATACPADVLRINSYNTSIRTLRIAGLNPALKYHFQFYASRANTGNSTVFQIGNVIDTVDTDNNSNDMARFTNIVPDRLGNVYVTLSRIGTYNYLAGFTITELTAPATRSASSVAAPISNAGNTPASKPQLKLYPNPTKGQLQLQLSQVQGNQLASLSIIDLQGRVVLKQTFTTQVGQVISQNVSALSPGVYLVQVVCNGAVIVEKLVKQ